MSNEIATALGITTLAIGVPLNLYVAVRLWQLARAAPTVRVLQERAVAATIILIVVLIFGLVFINNDFDKPILTGDATKVITRLALLALAVIPAAYWWRIYRF